MTAMRVAPAMRPIDRPSPCARATQSLKSGDHAG
jgi:hypothetical protein